MRRDYSWLWLTLCACVGAFSYFTDISIPPIVFFGGLVLALLIYVSLSLERLHKKIDKAIERDASDR